MDVETINMIIKAVFALLGVIVTYVIAPLIKEKVSDSKLKKLLEYTEIAERAAKELFKTNEDKREYVINAITIYAYRELGLELDGSTVRLVLEGVYNLYKDSINEVSE